MRTENQRADESNRVLIIGGNDPETDLLLMPAIKQIREQNKDARFDVLCGPASKEIIKEIGWFDKIIVHHNFLSMRTCRTLRNEKYKLVVCFRPSIFPYIVRTNRRLVFLTKKLFTDRFFTHESVNFIKMIEPFFGKPSENEFYFPITESDRQHVRNFLKSVDIPGSTILVAINPGNPDLPDKWSVANYLEVCNTLIEEYNAMILLFGESGDPVVKEVIASVKQKSKVLDMSGVKNPREIVAFLEKANLAITRDGLFLYLACSARTPVVSIFGAGNPYRYGPLGKKYIIIHADMDCFPCNKKRKCNKNYQCIKTIEPEKVIDAARLMLDESKQLFLFE
ncbi:MAG: glycosyltransferase family 9 protein [Candidatus Omnitrophica bacterium]|nr:glycosyltransferase family 9 protein [Candidatus Omnitrophota bacterium]